MQRIATFRPHRIAAVCAAMLAPLGAQSGIVAGGGFFTGPSSIALGPGDTVAPSIAAWMGNPGLGSLTVDNASFLQLARLSFGSGGAGNGTGLFSGANTRVQLVGDGFSNSQVQRLIVGDWGTGTLTVNQGALLDTSGNQAPCLLMAHYCDNFVGSAAGDTAVLNIDGSGTRVRTGQNLFVSHPGLAVQSLDGYTYGVPGGTTRGTVNVTGGASLVTDRAQVATRHWSTAATGHERNIAEVNVSGAGSRWEVVGGLMVNHANGQVFDGGATLITANDRNAWATLRIAAGGVLDVGGSANVYNAISLTSGGGRTDAVVTGSGSKIQFSAPNGVFQVGRTLGSATLDVLAAGQVLGVWYGSVGRDASFGTLVLDGVDSLLRADGTATATANGTAQVAVFDIGRGGGNGHVTVSGGARLEVLATEARTNGPQLSVGRDANSAGTLNISGAGSTVLVSAESVAPGAGEAWNPFVRIGREGNGTLNITGGGQLLLQGGAVSTPTDTRRTSLFIGGSGDTTIGGRGIASVSGAGSLISVTGSDAYIGVGHGPQASGQLTMSNQARAAATLMAVGNFGGTGVVKLDNARVELSGQYTGQGEFGAALVIGAGTGAVGNMSMAGASVVRLENTLGKGTGVTIGGSGTVPGGDGSLTMSGGSRLELVAPANNSALSVGRNGSGLLRLQSGSVIDLGGSSLFVGREAGSDGTLIATGGSTINAGWVGVGRNRDAAAPGGSIDGGTATMVLNGATLNATDIVIGTNGFLGGSAGSINASGTITNYGIFSPGNSPGVFTINGDYVAGPGSRLILEVADDGSGGFLTDDVRFGAGVDIDLASLNIEFRFLGNADPNAFKASGKFVIDTFVRQADAGGALLGLDPTAYASVDFSAQADAYRFTEFSFSATDGATLTAVPIPEPGTWGLLSGGLALLGWRTRRRQRA